MLKNHKRGIAAVVAAMGLGPLLVACGGGSTGNASAAADVYTKYAGMSGQARTTALVAAAKKEGKLSLYSTNSSIDKIVPEFEKEYGIKVTVYRATTEDLRTRILQEASAHRIQNDVVETKDSEMAILNQKGLVTPYSSEIADKLPAEAKPDKMVGDYYIETLPLFNPKGVKESDLPTDISGFADPKWKGKIAVDQGDFNWYEDLYNYETKTKGMSADDFASMMKKVAANFRPGNGHTATTQLMQAGDVPVMPDDFLNFSAPASTADTSFSPVTRQVIGTDMMKEAPHPAAAVLWCDWYLTTGQKYLAKAGYTPTNDAAVPGYKPVLPADTTYEYDDWKTLSSSKGNDWSTAWSNLLKGQDPVVPE